MIASYGTLRVGSVSSIRFVADDDGLNMPLSVRMGAGRLSDHVFTGGSVAMLQPTDMPCLVPALCHRNHSSVVPTGYEGRKEKRSMHVSTGSDLGL